MQKGEKLILFLLLAGAVVVAINTRTESGLIVQERTVDQYSDMFFTYMVIRYPAKVEVLTATANLTVGFNVGTDVLDFSRVETGASVKKQLNLTTLDGKSSRITVKSKGSIGPLLSFGQNDFLLDGSGTISVTMTARDPGNYTGEVTVFAQRSNDMLAWLLGY